MIMIIVHLGSFWGPHLCKPSILSILARVEVEVQEVAHFRCRLQRSLLARPLITTRELEPEEEEEE